MARQISAVEVNKFNAGLNTDSSPLTSPDNSSLEESNLVLNIDGSINRRLGMDLEDDYDIITTTVANAGSIKIGITTYRWDNAGGDPDRAIEVVQVGNELKFFELTSTSISKGLIQTILLSASPTTNKYSYTVVDGILVIATGLQEIHSFTYLDGIISYTTSRLLVRDFFGVEDVLSGVNLLQGTAVSDRPTTPTDAHIYNLRNQSWGIPRVQANAEVITDPIGFFYPVAGGRYPSNADSVIQALYPDAEDVDNRTIDRFFAPDLVKNPVGSGRAASGYFIIDALDRGVSRMANELSNRARYPELASIIVNTLPDDITPTGATSVTEFAGRVCYAGFPGTTIDGDANSPKMSSYVLFSKVVDSTADINVCYQEGDPTSKETPDIIDTDGGFIRINEAYGIKRLISLGGSLMIVAANGVWSVVGGTDNGFTASNYTVEKISDRGCTSQESIVVIDNSFMFWGDDAIYHVTTDQFGSWVCNNISFARIQRLYDGINIEDKRWAKGEYDTYERKVRWLYNNRTIDSTPTKELVLDLQLQAFYSNTIMQFDGSILPRLVTMYVGNPYQINLDEVAIVVNGNDVVIDSEEVIISTETRTGISQREIGYVAVTSINPVVQYTFATYRNPDFRDWYSIDNVGVDADGYVVTSFLSGTDFQRDKQVPYITIHCRRTESGFQAVGDLLVPINQSSCLVQARWDWSNTNKTSKWGREFQAYRYRQLYIPQNVDDDYDNGFLTVVTRNKLRGNGKVLSLKFRTEPYRNFHLYGWSMLFSVSENV